jgi:hypothetical protein
MHRRATQHSLLSQRTRAADLPVNWKSPLKSRLWRSLLFPGLGQLSALSLEVAFQFVDHVAKVSICTSCRLFGWHDHANPLNLQSKRPVAARWTAGKGGYFQFYAIAFLLTMTDMSGFWHLVRAAPPDGPRLKVAHFAHGVVDPWPPHSETRPGSVSRPTRALAHDRGCGVPHTFAASKTNRVKVTGRGCGGTVRWTRI